ncbi:3-sulfinopropanoyl-CoA desulfinase [Pelagibius sp. Alg239-R121]|uniref:3-sulfinopropanoyl-CoA desulfinase n=1 Tax=Pelagibius sp. Alg239-R121 TaxID=2993448 RepID=UPI0024A6A0E4|nr:3-sulfinopropanoyl-CoA desulfinase [Pelagibius sp. Alg239-R121]
MPENLSGNQIELRARARALAQEVIAQRAAAIDREETYPWDNVRALNEAGFFGMTIPEEHGGAGLSYLDATLVIEEMAKVCGVTGRIAVEANMGAIGAIMAYGTQAQKSLAANIVLSGDKPAICITEPTAGSAATEMITRADRKGDYYIINGGKHWITGGGVSRLHLVFARVFDGAAEQGIGGFIVVRDEVPDLEVGQPEAGLIVGRREPTMGLRGIPETEILFKDLAVHKDMLLMPPQGLRRGFGALMTAYNAQRVGAGTVALGLAAGAYEKALDYSKSREQFGRPICEFQGLQWMLADMSIQVDAARALLHKAAAGEGFPDVLEAAQAKVFASEMAIKVTSDALQVFGAAGYSRNNPMERMMRDARMFTIGGGTAQILRTVIASSILGRKLPQSRDGYLNLPR